MINKVTLVGNLGRDPESRSLPSGQTVTKFSVATKEVWGDSGHRQEKTSWHNVSVFGKQAEACAQYLSKGRLVYVEGRIDYQEYEARDGSGKRYRTEIVARDVKFLGGGNGARREPGDEGDIDSGSGDGQRHAPPLDDDDVPF